MEDQHPRRSRSLFKAFLDIQLWILHRHLEGEESTQAVLSNQLVLVKFQGNLKLGTIKLVDHQYKLKACRMKSLEGIKTHLLLIWEVLCLFKLGLSFNLVLVFHQVLSCRIPEKDPGIFIPSLQPCQLAEHLLCM